MTHTTHRDPSEKTSRTSVASSHRRARPRVSKLWKSKSAFIGGFIVLTVVLTAILAPVIAPYDPTELTADRLESFSTRHFFGTDKYGRDVFSRVIWGSRVSLAIGLVASLGACVIGSAIGLVSGYAGGVVDIVIMRLIDIMLALPLIVLALVLVAFMGAGLMNVSIAVAISITPALVRVARAEALRYKELDHVTAARAIGAGPGRIVAYHILPLALPPILILATLRVASTILIESSLSFLGLGVARSVPTWGGMLSDGRSYLVTQPALTIVPGLAIMVTVIGFNLLGDGLNDLLNRRLQDKR